MNTNICFKDEDDFNREPIARKVWGLLNLESGASPLLIDGNWGTGKTSFCHKLRNHIGISWKTAYIDAFRADSCEQPIIAILAEVLKLVPEPNTRENYRKKLAPIAKTVLKTSLQIGANWLTKSSIEDIQGNFETELSKETEKLLESTAKKLTDKAIENIAESVIKQQEEAEQNLTSLKRILEEICREQHHVIFIDELDRCKPDFSIKLLETIKHVFDIKNLSFVLVANTAILKASIEHHYGNKVDAELYLDKFIGFKFSLPSLHNAGGNQPAHTSYTYLNIELSKSYVLKDCAIVETHSHLLNHLISVNNASLRTVEKFVRNLEFYQILAEDENIGLSSSQNNFHKLQRILAIFIFTVDEPLSNTIARGKLPHESMQSILAKPFNRMHHEITKPNNEVEILHQILRVQADGLPRSGDQLASVKKNIEDIYGFEDFDVNGCTKSINEAMRILKHLSHTH